MEKNHCVKESTYPKRMAFCVGSTVMLLKNYVVEENIMNGSIGVIEDIVYEQSSGLLSDSYSLPSYAIVNFKNASIPYNLKAFPNISSTCIPIPVATERCEKKCSSITTIPLCVCVALSIHKSHSITFGFSQNFEKVVVNLSSASNNINSTSGLELVALSHVTSPSALAICNPSNTLTVSDTKNIGQYATNSEIKKFQESISSKYETSKNVTCDRIKLLDNDHNELHFKKIECGCKFLPDWYQSVT